MISPMISSRIKTAPKGGGTPLRGLTHSLDLSKEGLGMNPTRICTIDGCTSTYDGTTTVEDISVTARFDRNGDDWDVPVTPDMTLEVHP